MIVEGEQSGQTCPVSMEGARLVFGLFSSGWEGNTVWLSRGLTGWRNGCQSGTGCIA